MKAIIMAAGQSTRTYPLTLARPKPLLKVMNTPILAHQLEALRGLVDAAIVVVGYKKEMIREAFGTAYQGIALEYVEQNEQLGTGHAIFLCAPHVNGPFLAMNGDDLYDPEDLRALAKVDQGALAQEVPDPRLYGIYEVTAENHVVRLVEKPQEVFSNLANVGAYKFTPEVFDAIPKIARSERGEIEITSAIQTLAEQGPFRVVRAAGYWLPMGYPWHLLDANEFFLNTRLEGEIQGEVSAAAHLNGVVATGEGTVVRPGVVIDGPVCIGRNCSIGPNCWIRPGTAVGDGCRVGHGVEIKNSILFDGAHVPHLSYVGDSIIGEHSNLGCGTITANVRHDGGHVRSMVKGIAIDTGRKKLGAIIGDHVHTGINTSIYPGRKLWPHTSTLPGEVVKKDIEK
ncbi:MAG: NTP transferase domain-containing protein [Candidatus Hydrogenedentes bacterium]|nr:NTP transferase domain-containing protein [Candidatus Hydrogenedentota bacterium]